MKIFYRNLYLKKIEPYINKNIIKVITGQRRVGKSFILLQLIERIKKKFTDLNIIFIDKEKFEFRSICDSNTLFEYISAKSSKDKLNFVFIDEIQEIKDFKSALLEFYNRDNFDIYITGSNSTLFAGDLSSNLAGRFIEFTIHPLSFNEFVEFHGFEPTKDTLFNYIKFGGLPYLVHLEFDEIVINEYLKNIVNTVLLKDIVAGYNIRNVNFFERLILFFSENIGTVFSAKRISDFLKAQKIKLSVNTILNYISYLNNVFLLHSVAKYDIKGKKKFEIFEKYYFEDLGIRNSIVPYNITDISKIMENLVYNHLLINNYNVFVGKLNSKEIDFVAVKNNKTVYIQVCYMLGDDAVIEREFGNLLKIQDNYRKIVVSLDEYANHDFKGIEHLNLLDFLKVFD